MASTTVTLTRDAYTELGDAGDVVTIALPELPVRIGNFDRCELTIAASAPTVPDPVVKALKASIVMENSSYPNSVNVMAAIEVPDGEKLYGRWLGTRDYRDPADLYVVKF